MGLLDRAPRAAASALLLATAIGAAGTTGMSAALAVDPPATLPLSGVLVDEDGAPLAGVDLLISEELPPDGGLAGFPATTGADGSFQVEIYPWGTVEAPASLTVRTPTGEQVETTVQECVRTIGVTLSDSRELTLEGATEPPKPLDLVAATTVLGEVCDTTGTPAPGAGNGSGGGVRHVTPPPTDVLRTAIVTTEDRLGPALVVGFLVGLVIAAALLLPRPGTRRRG